MIAQICEESKCTGCLACMNLCPCGAITCQEREDGNVIPQIDPEKCIECHRCVQGCPENHVKEKHEPRQCYATWQKDRKERKYSASGGIAFGFYKRWIQNAGIVYGAAFNEKGILTQQKAETLEEARKFRGSKYVQSYNGFSYSEIGKELKKGKKPETVARQYAFKSSSRFSRAFHEEYGMTPEKYYKEEFRNEEWIRYIDEHMKEELTAEQLAKEFHYSKDHFRKEFQDVFGMGPITYITQRKVQFAAKALREGKLPAEVGKEYGFCSRNGFDKAFRRVFYTSPAKYARAGAKVVNLDRYYSEYKDKIKISYIDMDEIKMAGWTIIANRREADIPAQLAFWLDEHSPQYRKLNALTGEEKGRDKIALWYQEKENIEYILGPIVESFDNLPEDAFQVTIAAGRYAVFESDQENDMENLPETVRMFARCVLYGWIREHRDELSLQRLTFEWYTSQKMYLYVPVSEKGTGGNERKDEKNFEKQSEK